MATTNAKRVIITAQSPLSFSQRKPGGIYQQSLDYIPGSILRGAVAEALLRGELQAHKTHTFDADCDFCRLFLSDEAVVFTNAYPFQPTEGEDGPFVIPVTAMSCKSHPGFQAESEEDESKEDESCEEDKSGHGVFDTLIDRLCWERLEPAGLLYAPTCPDCGGRLDRFSAIFGRSKQRKYYRHKVSQQLLTRVAINRRRAVAEEGMLYSPWVIPPEAEVSYKVQVNGSEKRTKIITKYYPRQFVGYLHGANKEVVCAFKSLTALGGGKSRGLNQIKVKIASDEPQQDDWQAVEGRIKQFNCTLAKVWSVYQALGGDEKSLSGTYFTVGLQADAILRTVDGRSTMVLSPDGLNQALGDVFSPQQLTLVRSYASYHYAGGWHSAWKLPKPAELITDRGTVYVFHSTGSLTEDQYQALADLEAYGVGERTSEGFGQVRVCDEFHLVRRNKPA